MRQSRFFSGGYMLWAALIIGLLLSSGCGYIPGSRMIGPQYYLIDVPVCAHGIDQNETGKNQTQTRAAITDQTIIDCKTTVVSTLRERMNNARLGRTAGGFIRVVTAAVSAMLTGATGASSLATATILSGTSAIIPEISSVIETKERAEVYSKGIETIEEAYGQYLEHLKEETRMAEQKPSPAAIFDKVYQKEGVLS